MAKEKEYLIGVRRFGHMPRWILVFILLASVLLTSCASDWRVQHGIFLMVKGTLPLYDIQVVYGDKVIEMPGKAAPGGGSGWNARMVVPEVMIVRWTAESERHEVTIPVKKKLDPDHPIENWILVFDAHRVELIRQVLLATSPMPIGLRSRGDTNVYP